MVNINPYAAAVDFVITIEPGPVTDDVSKLDVVAIKANCCIY